MHPETLDGFRLSQQQRRLWLSGHGKAAFTAQGVVLLEGQLHLPTLESAVQSVIERHEILRTTFHQITGMRFPVQVVHERSTPSWSYIDLSHLDRKERESRIEELCRQEQRRDFMLDRDPLLHLTLITLGPREYFLLVCVPSLCADSWTLRNFVQQMAACYEASTSIEQPAQETIQYVQFAEWQNNLVRSENAAPAREYWETLLPESWTAPSLPYEIRTSEGSEFSPERVSIPLAAETCATLSDVAAQPGIEVDSFLLAVWHTLIWRLTGGSEVLVGRMLACREHEMLLGAFGPFEKCVPAVARFNSLIAISSVARSIALAMPAMVDAQEYFDGEKFQPIRRPEGGAFFSFVYSSEDWPRVFKAGDLTLTIQDTRVCSEAFRVMLKVIRGENPWRAELFYDSDHFQADDMHYLGRLFKTLLNSAIASPEASVGTLEIVSDRERQEFVLDGPETDYPESCVHGLFEQQAELRPEAVAVVCGAERWSYRQLNERANQVARYLQRQGVGIESRVGLLLERSPWLLCGVLGVLKAGAAYVPLDVLSPAMRLQEQVEAAGVAVVLTEQRWLEKLAGVKVLRVDGAEGRALAQESRAEVARAVTAENLAYVIYTSGSTGKPKGVMVSHGAVSNLAAALKNSIYQHLRRQRRVSLNAPLTFDASVKQWVQLLDGHTVDIIPEELRYDPATLLSYARQHSIDVLDCTPSQLRALVAVGLLDEDPHAFAAVLCGGDQLDEKTWHAVSNSTNTRFYNVYGPTECTVDATICAINPEQTWPILGLPIQNTRIYWLDSQLKQVPLGVAGEIFIGGVGVARGYLGRPDLTAERFIPDPFSTNPGARLYKTGDMTRYYRGALEFLGRQDHQVKIRGLRIELEEIETLLKSHPAVHDAVVLVREDAQEKHLVGYVAVFTAYEQTSIDLKSELRSFLRERLIEFMVPATIILCEALPLTRHGKVDRAALLTMTERPVVKEYLPPRNATETAIAAIWCEVLEIEKVGLHDNFFDLGGHSLLMARVYGRLKETTKRDFSMIEMFTHPTVSSFAEFLTGAATKEKMQTRDLIHERAARQKQASAKQGQLVAARRNS